MSLHIQWMRFRRECLKGQSKDQIRAAKQLFYCGAAAAADSIIKHINVARAPTSLGLRCINGVQTELRQFQEKAAKEAQL